MLKDRQEILAMGELVLFVAIWGISLWAAILHYRGGDQPTTGNSIASTNRIERADQKLD